MKRIQAYTSLLFATSHNSRMLHLRTGVVKTGAPADVLVVSGDPTTDIGAVKHIVAVYHHGVVVAQ